MSAPKAGAGAVDLDERFARILLAAITADARGEPPNKSIEQVGKLLSKADEGDRTALEAAWRVFDDIRHEFKRKSAAESVAYLQALTASGFPRSSSVMFERLFPQLSDVAFPEVLPALVTAQTVDRWLKLSHRKPAECGAYFIGRPGELYAAVLADWAAGRLPPAKLLPLAQRALSGERRPDHLAAPRVLLGVMIRKDTKAALASKLLEKVDLSSAELSNLIEAVVACQPSSSAWAAALAKWLRLRSHADKAESLLLPIEKALLVLQGAELAAVAAFSCSFIALLGADHRPPKDSDKSWIDAIAARLMQAALGASRGPDNSSIWICGPATSLSGQSDLSGNVSVDGAMRVALALRARDEGAESGQALAMVATNLGISGFEKPGEIVEFEPSRHEDRGGGLLPGDKAQVVSCGWEWRGNVLLRGTVVPS